ncbi:MAG: Uma2 family endonuclease, partial [Longimonas sp.]|uniref:Uma2 family endonuclease n=1 Tax=Longimonas sp. TaxID=2039626 RepID=UPI0033529FC2
MDTAVASRSAAPAHRWTRAQYERMVDAGVLGPNDRVELIHGQIVPMGPQNSRHAAVTTKLMNTLVGICPDSHHVRSQVPLALGADSEPEPDVMVVPGSNEDFLDAHPTAATLVVEVAATSLAFDQDTKRRL